MTLSPVDIEAYIQRTLQQLEDATDDFRTLAIAAAEADVVYKREYAKAQLAASGRTVAERDAHAVLATERHLLERKISEAKLLAQKELLTSLRARLDSFRTLAANVRAQT